MEIDKQSLLKEAYEWLNIAKNHTDDADIVWWCLRNSQYWLTKAIPGISQQLTFNQLEALIIREQTMERSYESSTA